MNLMNSVFKDYFAPQPVEGGARWERTSNCGVAVEVPAPELGVDNIEIREKSITIERDGVRVLAWASEGVGGYWDLYVAPDVFGATKSVDAPHYSILAIGDAAIVWSRFRQAVEGAIRISEVCGREEA